MAPVFTQYVNLIFQTCEGYKVLISKVAWQTSVKIIVTPIFSSRKTAVCPIIDVISDDNFQYITGGDTTWGGFNWRLNFRWYPSPKREMERRGNDRTVPMR